MNLAIKEIINRYHASTTRYQHLAFSCKDISVLPKIYTALKQYCPNYQTWDKENPVIDFNISRHELIKAVFEKNYQGLIINDFRDCDWQQSWSNLDKQAFWSALGGRDGGYPVMVVIPESNEFKQLSHRYLNAKTIDNTDIIYRVSNKKQFF